MAPQALVVLGTLRPSYVPKVKVNRWSYAVCPPREVGCRGRAFNDNAASVPQTERDRLTPPARA
jgi:hypothetical protein